MSVQGVSSPQRLLYKLTIIAAYCCDKHALHPIAPSSSPNEPNGKARKSGDLTEEGAKL